MERNYKLTDDTIVFNGRTLHRIQAIKNFRDIKKGDLGGWIESYENLSDNAWVYGDAVVFGNAEVYGSAIVYENAVVCGEAEVYGNAKINGDGVITSDNDYCFFSGFGSVNRTTTFFKTKDNSIYVVCGCFKGTLQEFENKVKETHKGNKYEREYLKMIEMIKIKFDIE